MNTDKHATAFAMILQAARQGKRLVMPGTGCRMLDTCKARETTNDGRPAVAIAGHGIATEQNAADLLPVAIV